MKTRRLTKRCRDEITLTAFRHHRRPVPRRPGQAVGRPGPDWAAGQGRVHLSGRGYHRRPSVIGDDLLPQGRRSLQADRPSRRRSDADTQIPRSQQLEGGEGTTCQDARHGQGVRVVGYVQGAEMSTFRLVRIARGEKSLVKAGSYGELQNRLKQLRSGTRKGASGHGGKNPSAMRSKRPTEKTHERIHRLHLH